nr:four helix bundle protein [uncultured Carboxylicivirga sp.]
MSEQKSNLIIDLSFQFSLDVIEFCEELELKRKFVIAKQLLKSGTSIGANVREAQSAESRADFIHKMKIAAKEAEETEYWLELCKYSKSYPINNELLINIRSIILVISKIVGTTRKN